MLLSLMLGGLCTVLSMVIQVIAVYGSVAVAVFDAFWKSSGTRQKLEPS